MVQVAHGHKQPGHLRIRLLHAKVHLLSLQILVFKCSFNIYIVKVTGGNRGIGYAIVKRLCKEFNGVVLFTGNYS